MVDTTEERFLLASGFRGHSSCSYGGKPPRRGALEKQSCPHGSPEVQMKEVTPFLQLGSPPSYHSYDRPITSQWHRQLDQWAFCGKTSHPNPNELVFSEVARLLTPPLLVLFIR